LSSDETRLRHIVECAEELAEYLQGQDEADFLENRLLRRAAERLLTIIGEAAKHLTPETRKQIPVPWQDIIRFRDKGIHGYDSLRPSTIFAIAKVAVPELQRAVERYRSTRDVGAASQRNFRTSTPRAKSPVKR